MLGSKTYDKRLPSYTNMEKKRPSKSQSYDTYMGVMVGPGAPHTVLGVWIT